MNSFHRPALVALATACILLSGCASSSNEAPDASSIRPSDTSLPPASAASESSPTSGAANADPHGFTQ